MEIRSQEFQLFFGKADIKYSEFYTELFKKSTWYSKPHDAGCGIREVNIKLVVNTVDFSSAPSSYNLYITLKSVSLFIADWTLSV